jgi:virginiamycin B lyase
MVGREDDGASRRVCPHDVAVGPSGEVWCAGQNLGIAGRLNPASGEIERIPLGKKSAPHGVIVGPDGAPWFTDGGQNAIVRVDPATKHLKIWPLPPERMPYTNLNTAAFDGKGRIWFTGQNGIYGRLNPTAGDMKVWDAPKGHGPYGITGTQNSTMRSLAQGVPRSRCRSHLVSA